MRRYLYILIAGFLMAACGPLRHAVHVEMRHPSKSGLELAGKRVSAVYYIGDDALENQIVDSLAHGFAKALENDYQTGDGSVSVVGLPRSAGDYASRDSLIHLLVKNGGDVVFLFDVTFSHSTNPGMRPIKVSMYCYDGMNKEDVVKEFVGSTLLQYSIPEELLTEAVKAGSHIAESFKMQWKHEQYSIAYYDSEKWLEALIRADKYDWKGAMDIWLTLLDSNDPLKRAVAEYNIAVACYLSGEFQLAKSWLDRSDAENKMPTLSDAMRKRIEARIL